jgi:hypothetical protein
MKKSGAITVLKRSKKCDNIVKEIKRNFNVIKEIDEEKDRILIIRVLHVSPRGVSKIEDL